MKQIILFIGATMIAASPVNAEVRGGDTYVGVYAGISSTAPHYEELISTGMDRNPSMNGAVAGIFIGHDIKSKGMLAGVETDFGLLNSHAPNDPADANWYTAYKAKWNAHLRGRLGVAIGKSTKLYVAGGIAALRMVVDDTDPDWGMVTQTHLGWSLGGGIEHKIGPAFIIRADYIHDDFATRTGNITYQGVPYYGFRTGPTSDTMRVGIGYRF